MSKYLSRADFNDAFDLMIEHIKIEGKHQLHSQLQRL